MNMKCIARIGTAGRSFLRAMSAVLPAAFLLSAVGAAHAQQLFSDNFDTDSSAQWDVFEGSIDNVPDYTVEWAADYSTNVYTFNGTNRTVPPSPNGGGTSRGVRLTVNNNDDTAAAAAVSLYPKGQTFSGEYSVKFDMWLNYNGPAYGGTGSTEHGAFGLNHPGTRVNWPDGNFVSDGVWFTVAGEAGAGVNTISDYGAYFGDGAGPAVWLRGMDGGYVHGEEVNAAAANGLKDIFFAPEYESPGAPGKHWVEVELRQRSVGGTPLVTWLMNGYVIAEHSRGSAEGIVNGNLMLGYIDFFNSIANPRAENFALFDNLRVENLTGKPVNPVVSIAVDDGVAAEPANNASVTITRAGDLAGPLTVGLRAGGTAQSGVDFEALPASVTFAAGQAQTNLTVTILNDAVGEPVETIRIVLVGGDDYDVGVDLVAEVELADDGDVSVATLRVTKPVAYELNPARVGRFVVDLVPASLADTEVNYTVSGTAVNGTDYNLLDGTVTIPAGETAGVIDVVPKDNSVIEPDRSITITVTAGTGYGLGTNLTGSVTLRSDDLEAGTSLYKETFDVDPTANWVVNLGPTDGVADFFFDYSSVGIPPAPRSTGGTTRGLKLQANLTTGVFGGLSVSPVSQTFTGDVRLRFDIWQNFNGPAPLGGSGSTQITGSGIGTAGTTAQWPGGGQDSVWFATTGDGQSAVDYRAYSPEAATGYTEASGVFAAGTAAGVRNQSHPYYAEFGGETAPEAQVAAFPNQTGATAAGAQGFQWHDGVIERRGNQISWYIDGLRIATVDASTITFGGGNILFCQSDINAGSSSDPDAPFMAFGLIDNVQVETLPEGGEVSIATVRVAKPVAYELNPARIGRMVVDLLPARLTDTEINYTVSGTAVNGTDYNLLDGTVTIPAGQTTGVIDVVPKDNNVIEADRSITITVTAGTGYQLGTNLTASVTLRSDDLEAGTTVYTETFEVDHTADWVVNLGPTDGVADFFFDYSSVGIPPAPRSAGASTRGLKLQANLATGVFGGVSVSPLGQTFTGDIRLRFDIWQNYNGPLPAGGSGSTQITGSGIGTAGTTAQWPGGGQDSVWFAATGDGGSGVDYRAYSPEAATGYTEASGVFAAGTAAGVRNQSDPYYAEFGAEPAPAAQLALFPNQTGTTAVGAQGFQWHDGVIEKRGNQVSWYIDGLRIATVDASTITFGGGNILFNQSDINASSSTDPDAPSLAFGLIDNVRVETLATLPAEPVITGTQVVDGKLRIAFTGAAGDPPSAFRLVGSPDLPGTFVVEAGAVITAGAAAGEFVAEIPVAAGNRFFRVGR